MKWNQNFANKIAYTSIYSLMLIIFVALMAFNTSDIFAQNSSIQEEQPNEKITFTEVVDCFVTPCNSNEAEYLVNAVPPAAPSANINQSTTTALIGVAFNNVTLKELQNNKENIKSSVIKYIDTSLENLISGKARTITFCPEEPFIKTPNNECKMTMGIIVPKQWDKAFRD